MKALPKGVGAVLASFLRACDDKMVVVYGPYPPCEGRTRWRLQVYDPATKRKQNLTAESEEAARALIPLLEIEFKRHSPLLLHEVLAQYLEYKATIAQSQWVLTLGERLRSFLPNVPVQRLTPEDAETLYENETKRVGRFGVESAATHQALLRNTKEFFRWLCKRKLATSNPFENVDPIGRVHVGKAQPRETDAKRLDSVLMEAAKGGDEGALALLVQIYLGLRPGEVLSLQVDAIERQGTKVSIARGKTKNAKRSLELFADVAVLLWRYCQGRPGEQRVFAAVLPQKPATNWMYKRLHKFCAVAGLPKFCPHSLRGLHSSLALASGATTHQVAASLGHANFSTTARHYADPAVIDNARAQRMVATLKSGGSVDQLLDSLSPEQREALIHSLTRK